MILGLQSRICHFTQWLIRPFNTIIACRDVCNMWCTSDFKTVTANDLFSIPLIFSCNDVKMSFCFVVSI